MSYVIACGDEGIQLNQGTRLAVVGAGFRLEHFPEVLKAIRTVFNLPGKKVFILSNDENEWVKNILDLIDWDQINASMQQHIEALADREKITYVGHLSFTDPRVLENDIKGHMVRPHGIHVAKRICFTLGGGEQKYNLGNYVISADWIAEAPLKVAREVINTQIAFYKKLANRELEYVFEESGELGEKIAQKNRKILEKILEK